MNTVLRFSITIMCAATMVTALYAADDCVSLNVTGTLDEYTIIKEIKVPQKGEWQRIFAIFKHAAGLQGDLRFLVVKKKFVVAKEGDANQKQGRAVFYSPTDFYDIVKMPNKQLNLFVHKNPVTEAVCLSMSHWAMGQTAVSDEQE